MMKEGTAAHTTPLLATGCEACWETLGRSCSCSESLFTRIISPPNATEFERFCSTRLGASRVAPGIANVTGNGNRMTQDQVVQKSVNPSEHIYQR